MAVSCHFWRKSMFLVGALVVCASASRAADALFEDVTATHLPALLGLSMDAAIADFDGDGDLDIVIANEFRPNILLINDGMGGFEDESVARLPRINRDSEDVAVADFDGNGYPDIVVVTEDGLVNELYLNNGSGFFSDASDRLPVTGRSNAVLAANIGGDPGPDILIGNNGQNVILINDGNGFFVEETSQRLPVMMDSTQDLELGDVDGDLDLDLLVGNEGRNLLLINNGAGVFSDESDARIPLRDAPEETREADFGDVNGDGHLDVFFANVRAFVFTAVAQNRILINDGDGFFSDETAARLPVDADNSFDADFLDVDDDGDEDIVVANLGGLTASESVPYLVYRNDSAGFFEDATSAFFPSGVFGNGLDIESADFDGDGREDLFLSSRAGTDRLLLSTSGDLFRRGDADLGGSVDLADALLILFHLSEGVAVDCSDALDASDDGVLGVQDALTILRYLFLADGLPAAPGPRDCGPDPTDDALQCRSYDSCGIRGL